MKRRSLLEFLVAAPFAPPLPVTPPSFKQGKIEYVRMSLVPLSLPAPLAPGNESVIQCALQRAFKINRFLFTGSLADRFEIQLINQWLPGILFAETAAGISINPIDPGTLLEVGIRNVGETTLQGNLGYVTGFSK